mgnify:CR=1 FL=1
MILYFFNSKGSSDSEDMNTLAYFSNSLTALSLFSNDMPLCPISCDAFHETNLNITYFSFSFNPSSDTSLDMNDYLNNYRRGGLGLHIINLVMDKIQYIPRSGDFPQNRLILTKYIK